MESPSLNELAHAFEALTTESFCQDIRPLFLSVDFDNGNCAVAHMCPEEVPLHLEVFGAVRDALVSGQQECTIVVLEDATLDDGGERMRETYPSSQFNKKASKW